VIRRRTGFNDYYLAALSWVDIFSSLPIYTICKSVTFLLFKFDLKYVKFKSADNSKIDRNGACSRQINQHD
jgi:hypothetical protein